MSKEARIILADDDPIMRDLACAKLAEAGYAVSAVENGALAFDLLKKDGADLVITDINMPEMDGYELTKSIRGDEKLGDTPVIMITSSDHTNSIENAFAAGATSFLNKPMNWTLFNHSVRFVLRAAKDQKELRDALEKAEAGERFKDSVMSVMSHELRTPLNAIIGFGQLISEMFEGSDNKLYQEYSTYIVEGGKRLLNSISDMLLASDARTGPIKLNEADTTLGAIIDEAMALEKIAVKSASAEIIFNIHDRDTELCCDGALMARAIAKLVNNAAKFSQEGVKIGIGAAVAKNGDLAILVKDNGPGISPDKLEEAMGAFSQTDMSSARSVEGLGLGLLLVQAIASAHGAKFKLDSKPDNGARALILMPASRIAGNTKSSDNAAA